MIVIAIIGIIAAVAVPQYQIYTNRTFVVNEGLNAARTHQLAITEYAVLNQSLPTATADIRLSSTGETPMVDTVSMSTDGSAALSIVFKAATAGVPGNIAGQSLVIAPDITSGNQAVTWFVDSAASTIPARFEPKL